MTLMDCIQQSTVFYDKRKKVCKDQRKKKNAWKEVSGKLGIAEVEAQTMYKQSEQNSKYMKRMRGKSGSEAANND